MTQARPYTTILPPPIEAMAVAYFTPLMDPVPVATRLPSPSATDDVVNGFLRLESAGGTQVDQMLMWDMSIILHAYSPLEPQAEDIIGTALAWGANSQGLTVPINGRDWFVTYSRATALATKQQDSLVPLTRYRAMVTWRIPGIALPDPTP
jgi:hypothetical protein